MKTPSQLKKDVAQHLLPDLTSKKQLLFGSGTTVNTIIEALRGSAIRCVSSSTATSQSLFASNLVEIQLDQLTDQPRTCIDGADLVFQDSRIIIKGHGGALVREKITWKHASEIIVTIDESKLATEITTTIPVAVIPFGLHTTKNRLRHLDQIDAVELHYRGGLPFRSDDALLILHLKVKPDTDLVELEKQLQTQVGVVETGIFLPTEFESLRFVCGTQDGIIEF